MSGTLSGLVERVVVVNLDRRPDRMQTVDTQLRALSVPYRRISAVDGRDPAVAAAWQAYAALPLATYAAGSRQIRSYREFYLGDREPADRVAFFEQTRRSKAIATAGAWGLLLSMTAVIKEALAAGTDSVLILEDDVLFHRHALDRLTRVRRLLPSNWLILQLGALQLHWEPDWISWHAPELYRCNGSSYGAHAVILRRPVLAELLAACRRRDLPYDIGALQEIKRRYRERCFTSYPNLAIQDAADSEIGMSQLGPEGSIPAGNPYRWHLPDYGVEAILHEPRSTLARLRRIGTALAAAGRELVRHPATKHSPPRAAATVAVPAAPLRSRFDLPPVVPLGAAHSGQEVVLALLVGAEPDLRERTIALLGRQLGGGKAVPVVVTDHDDFDALRACRLPFEYLPSPARVAARGLQELAWDTYRLRRLALLRRKYQPLRIVAFGPAARELLEQWRRSPFEADYPGPDLAVVAVEDGEPGACADLARAPRSRAADTLWKP
jgi:GR25 family glycosyltransferase involved in LPS biosynthesis